MVKTSPSATCPSSCPLSKRASGKLSGACYAEHGFLRANLWHNLDRLPVGGTFKNDEIKVHSLYDLMKAIKELPEGSLWRHNQAGDLDTKVRVNIHDVTLEIITNANRGRRGFTFTHHDVLNNGRNRRFIADANRKGFTINLSANSLKEADELADLYIAPVVSVVPKEMKKNTRTPKRPKGDYMSCDNK